jgi:hypothetical protein
MKLLIQQKELKEMNYAMSIKNPLKIRIKSII